MGKARQIKGIVQVGQVGKGGHKWAKVGISGQKWNKNPIFLIKNSFFPYIYNYIYLRISYTRYICKHSGRICGLVPVSHTNIRINLI